MTTDTELLPRLAAGSALSTAVAARPTIFDSWPPGCWMGGSPSNCGVVTPVHRTSVSLTTAQSTEGDRGSPPVPRMNFTWSFPVPTESPLSAISTVWAAEGTPLTDRGTVFTEPLTVVAAVWT